MINIFHIGFVVLYFIVVLLLFGFGIHSFLMIYLYRKNKTKCLMNKKPYHLSNRKLPEVTIQLPVFNEYYVIDRLIDSVVNIHWPQKKLVIQILDDSTDETTRKIKNKIKKLGDKGFRIHHFHRKNRTGHKAGALFESMAQTESDFIAIFDADFVPDPDFLLKCMPDFQDPEIGMVQARWGHINGLFSALTRAQTIILDGHFTIEQVARNSSGLWMNFNGTGGIWRKQCIQDAGGWQGDTLTEDFDLSYRAEMAGWKFKYLMDVVNPAEIPATIAAFKAQQFRWCKGSVQTLVKLMSRIFYSDFNWKIKWEAFIHMMNYFVHPLMIVNILLLLPLIAFADYLNSPFSIFTRQFLFFAIAFLSIGTMAPLVFYIYPQKELYSDWKQRILYVPFLMMIGTGIAVTTSRACAEALLGIKSGFKRTPKLNLINTTDKISSRNKYRIKIDPFSWIEILMGVYSLGLVFYSIKSGILFFIPLMLLYAAGFFYLGFGSVFADMKYRWNRAL